MYPASMPNRHVGSNAPLGSSVRTDSIPLAGRAITGCARDRADLLRMIGVIESDTN